MAHLVETMAYAGVTPWHGLGNQLTQKQPIEVWQREAGMDWAIQESPVHFKAELAGHLGSTLAARLQYFKAISGNRLACLPLELRLRGKSTRQSHGTPIFYVDLTVRSGVDMAEALQSANELDAQRQAVGFDQVALDETAQRGFGNGAFEDSEEDAGAVIEEFYLTEEIPCSTTSISPRSTKASLFEKLDRQAQRHTPLTDTHQGTPHTPRPVNLLVPTKSSHQSVKPTFC